MVEEASLDEDLEVEGAPSEEVARLLHETLETLQNDLNGILGSVLVDDTGFPLAWDLKGGADPSLIATVGSLLTRAADRSSATLDFGAMKNTVITTEKGTIALFRVSARIFLVVLLQPSTNNILVLVEVRKALDRLWEVIHPAY